MSSVILSKIQTRHGPQLDAEGLKKDCEEIRHQDDEKKSEPVRGPGSDLFGEGMGG